MSSLHLPNPSRACRNRTKLYFGLVGRLAKSCWDSETWILIDLDSLGYSDPRNSRGQSLGASEVVLKIRMSPPTSICGNWLKSSPFNSENSKNRPQTCFPVIENPHKQSERQQQKKESHEENVKFKRTCVEHWYQICRTSVSKQNKQHAIMYTIYISLYMQFSPQFPIQ